MSVNESKHKNEKIWFQSHDIDWNALEEQLHWEMHVTERHCGPTLAVKEDCPPSLITSFIAFSNSGQNWISSRDQVIFLEKLEISQGLSH
jgi:hypothetical protein